MPSKLMVHCGGQEISKKNLELIEAPPATETWFPLPHATVLRTVEETLDSSGFVVTNDWLSVSNENARFFGVLDIESQVCDGVSLSVGIRNSNDKKFPIGFCCGTRTFVCDNLAFSSEVVISKRHTRFGEDRFNEGVADAIASLGQFQEQEAVRIGQLKDRTLTADEANSVMLQSFEAGHIGARMLPRLITEWRKPTHEEFEPRTAYSMLNALTEVIKPRMERYPHRSALEIMRFQQLLLA